MEGVIGDTHAIGAQYDTGDDTRTAMNPKRFDELKSTGLLPSPTGVGLEIVRLARNDGTSIDEIARIIQTDPALTGRTLKYANNGNAAAGQAITTVRDAIVRIGVRSVTGMALGFSLVCNCRAGTCHGFDYPRFWAHSLGIALGGQALARRAKGVSPDDAFLAGLLCEIGRLALATLHPEKYSEILSVLKGRPESDLARLERSTFATDHNELTGAMLKDWGLPAFLTTAVQHFERLEEAELAAESKEQRLAEVLRTATLLADICVADNDQRAAAFVPEFLRRVDHLQIDSNEVINIAEETISQWQDWGRFLNITTWPVLPFEELLEKSWELAANAEQTTGDIPGESIPGTPLPDSAAPNLAASNLAARCPTRKGLRVLVADSDESTLGVLTRLLASSGHEVHSASSGDAALRVALETCPQLVITAWILPGIDGLELCRSLRTTEAGRQMYIIMLTGAADEHHLIDAFEAGADDFVVKPFQARPLFARIRAALRVIKLQEELSREKTRIEKISADLAIANRRLEMDALTDVLTGLPNRRYLIERLAHDWAVARRSGQPLSCMVLDIDHFKRINDTYGHDVGDRVLERVATILRSSIRSTDVVCRYGGEEFVIVGADSDLESTFRSAERLRCAVATETVALFPELKLPVTISIGIAVRSDQTRTPETLLKAADEAMYRAKEAGRNRVCGPRHALNGAHPPVETLVGSDPRTNRHGGRA